MSLLKPAWPWGFWVRNREGPTFLSNHPQFQSSFYHLIHHHKTRLCPCDPPVTQKNLCHSGTRSPIFLLSQVPRALEAFSMNDANQLPVLTHRKLSGTQPTQSTQSSLALSDVIGSFGFSLCLYVPPISAWSIGHCTIGILGAKLIEGQFSALLNNSQWHFSAPLDLVICQVLNWMYLLPEDLFCTISFKA